MYQYSMSEILSVQYSTGSRDFYSIILAPAVDSRLLKHYSKILVVLDSDTLDYELEYSNVIYCSTVDVQMFYS